MKLNYKVAGTGEPLIILHGLFGMLDNWGSIGRELSKYYTVYLVDQRNHGKSPHSMDFNYDLLAEDIKEFMTEVGIDKAHMIGHSMGGKSVMRFAQKYSEKCTSIIVLDIAPKAYAHGHNEIFSAIASMDLSAITTRKEADQQLALGIEDISIRQFLLKNLGRNEEKAFAWKANFKSLKANYESIINNIGPPSQSSVKSLFVRGARSHYIVESDAESIREYFPNAQIVDVDAGHWVHAERPKELLEIIMAFIDKK